MSATKRSSWLEPRLRFEGGDVVVHLSTKSEDTLVLPSSRLIAHSEWFKTSINWQGPQLKSKASVPVRQYGLVFDPVVETWTIQSIQGGAEDIEESPSFSLERTQCVQAHKIIFELLLEGKSFEDLSISHTAVDNDHLPVLLEFYQLFRDLSSRLEARFRTSKTLRSQILRNPCVYLFLAELLRCRAVYEEAMRHFVGRTEDMSYDRTHMFPQPDTESFHGRLNYKGHELNSGSRGKNYVYNLIQKFMSSETQALAQKLHLQLVRNLSELNRHLQNCVLDAHSGYSSFMLARGPGVMDDCTFFLARAAWLDWLSREVPSAQGQCTWSGASWMRKIIQANTKRTDWWNWCPQCGDPQRHGRCMVHEDALDVDEPKINIGFLGCYSLLDDIPRASTSRLSPDQAKARLKEYLAEQVSLAGALCMRRLRDDGITKPAMEIDYEHFYLTSIDLGGELMPWQRGDAELETEFVRGQRRWDYRRAEEEWLARGVIEVEDRLKKASAKWLRAIGVAR